VDSNKQLVPLVICFVERKVIWLSPKLGEIKKPQVREFRDVRKLFCLPLIPQLKEKSLHEDLENSIDQFWEQATHQLENLERTGKVSNIFFESITKDGEPGLEMVRQLSKQSYDIVEERIDKGAKLVMIENEEILDEFLDWSICLSLIGKSQKVLNEVLEFYKDVTVRRNKEIAKKIDSALKRNKSGLLVMNDENRLQIQPHLPSDIQVFLIHPPALNDIMRWFRDYWKKQTPL
jgi:hypothetical protein